MSASKPSLVTVTVEAAVETDPAGRGELRATAAVPAMAPVEKTKRRRLGTAGATQVLLAATANATTTAGNPKLSKRGVRKIRASAAAAASPAPASGVAATSTAPVPERYASTTAAEFVGLQFVLQFLLLAATAPRRSST